MEVLVLATFFIVVIINLALAFVVLLNNKDNRINQLFAITVFLIVAWIVSNFLADHIKIYSLALIFTKLTFNTTSLFALALLSFAIIFPKPNKNISPLKWALMIIPALIVNLLMVTDLIVKDIKMKEATGLDVVFGNFVFIFGLYFITYIVIAFTILVRKFLKSDGIERLQLKYLAFGLIISVILATITNFIIPTIFKAFTPSQFGPYFTVFFVAFTSYAIISKKLFGIRIILTELFTGLIALILLIQIITSSTVLMIIFNSFVFLIFCFLGYLLIKSILNEIKRREELRKLYEEVDHLSKTKSEFISIASHQLRTPLTAIKGYISMIVEGTYGKPEGKLVKPLQNVYQSNERLIRLVNDLLDLSRLEKGKIELMPQLMSLEEMVSNIVNELKINAENKGLYIKLVKPETPLPKVMADRDKLRQVVLNVVDNAIKYTQSGGITVEVVQVGSLEQIKVSDTGAGMSEKELKSLFQMFSRATAGTQLHVEGAGIGLYIARQFIEMHKGRIWAESKGENKGSTFYIELPITK